MLRFLIFTTSFLGILLGEFITGANYLLTLICGQSRVINGPFSGNINSNNFVIGGGDTTAWQRMMSDMMRGARFHPCIFVFIGLGENTDSLLGGSTDNAGPPRAPRGQPTERRARTQPYVSTPTQWSNSGMDSVADSPRYFSEGPIFDGRCPRLLAGGVNLTSHRPADRTPGRNPIIRA